jgi:ADP-heptose:LPS heptosyltransferase
LVFLCVKFLVIRLSSIGDIVLATAAIRCLKQQIPDAEVHFLTKEKMKAVTIANPYIDKFHYFTNDLSTLAKELRKENYDYIIDLHKNIRTYLLRLKLIRSKALWYSYHKLSVQKFLLTRLGVNLMPKRHISLRCVDALAPLGVVDDGKGLDYFIPLSEHINEHDLPSGHLFGYIAFVIGGTHNTKKLPVYKMREICSKINYPVILVGGKEDKETGEAIASVNQQKIFNACGKFSLNESADLVRKAHLVISHDTGLQYIASAYQKPILAIWGGTSPKLAVEPFYGTAKPALHKNFIVPDLPCQPCSNYGTKKCPRGHFKCMKNQDTDLIASTAMSVLKQ